MTDINFLIVNSKLNHAVLLRSELENRVSFDVLQDNDEVDVWNKMEGGKDDVYIYDRCGRLAYFIPYPLSVMSSADSLVPKAIKATHFQSPCGDTCGGNNSVADNKMVYSDSATVYTEMNHSTPHSNHSDNSHNISINDTSSQLDPSRNNIVILFFNSSINNSPTEHLSNDTETNQTSPRNNSSQNVPQRSARCVEADIEVCKDYSKRRLLRIQACCLADNSENLACRSFTSRRCKKLQTVIKCCIKTTISDPTTTESNVELETTTIAQEPAETSTDSENSVRVESSM